MEPQLHYLKERQNALISMKQYGCLGDALAILTAGMFLVDIAITLIQSIPRGLSYMPSLTTTFFGREVGGFAVSLLMLQLAWMIISTLGKSLNLTGWEPITAIPHGYLACCGVVITVMVLSSQSNEWSSPGRYCMTAFLMLLLLLRRDARKAERKQAQVALATKAQVKQSSQFSTKRQSKKCEVCQQESQYDLCLTCENKYRGERQRVRAQILRAKRAGVPATLTLSQWLSTVNTFHHHCAYCNGPYELMEHYIPISEGGGTTQDNCVPGCYACNSKKSNKHPEM